MASVDGSRSYLAGSDKILLHRCGPCKTDGEKKEAKYLCKTCKVYLCFDCGNQHKTFNATNGHSIVSALWYDMILDMKVKSTQEVEIKLTDDDCNPYITGCKFLSNSCILLCDYNNKKVKLLESDMSIKESMELSDLPWAVAAVGENEAIVTLPDSSALQYIYTYPNMKLGEKIDLPGKCFGICVVNDEIYTAYHRDSRHNEIWRLDKAGNIMDKSILTQSSSDGSEYLGLCLTGSNSRVYLTDYHNSRVTCFQLNDKMVYQYQDKDLKRPNGIYVDSVGNSLVCGSGSHNVVVITADGRKHGELLTFKDMGIPGCIDYRPEDNRLIIGCEDNSKLYVYKLGM